MSSYDTSENLERTGFFLSRKKEVVSRAVLFSNISIRMAKEPSRSSTGVRRRSGAFRSVFAIRGRLGRRWTSRLGISRLGSSADLPAICSGIYSTGLFAPIRPAVRPAVRIAVWPAVRSGLRSELRPQLWSELWSAIWTRISSSSPGQINSPQMLKVGIRMQLLHKSRRNRVGVCPHQRYRRC